MDETVKGCINKWTSEWVNSIRMKACKQLYHLITFYLSLHSVTRNQLLLHFSFFLSFFANAFSLLLFLQHHHSHRHLLLPPLLLFFLLFTAPLFFLYCSIILSSLLYYSLYLSLLLQFVWGFFSFIACVCCASIYK